MSCESDRPHPGLSEGSSSTEGDALPVTDRSDGDDCAGGDGLSAAPTEHDESRGCGEQAEAPSLSWEELGVATDRVALLQKLGYHRPMEVQTATYQAILDGRDLVVQSRTGSGKTLAFALPLIANIAKSEERGARVLALAPTRELAIQVADESARVTQGTSVEVTAVYGGAAIGPQVQRLAAGTQIVCGTPGRVLDHIRRKTLDVRCIRTLVLDEADEMLSMGFYEELTAILGALPNREQTLLFSATLPEDVQRLANKYLREPERLLLSEDFVGVKEIHHVYYLVSGMARPRDMLRVLEAERPESAIIFCNTREETNLVSRFLREAGFSAEALSSDLTQAERERAMQNLRERKTSFLVATDIAARGIDVAELSHVFNYRFPENADIYIHRTGRTGRAGRSGIAVSLVSPQELGDFYYMKLTHDISPEERFLPTATELAAQAEGERFAVLTRNIDEHDDSVEPEFLGLARRIWHSLRGEEIVALLLQEHFARPPRPERPLPNFDTDRSGDGAGARRQEGPDRAPDGRGGRYRDRGAEDGRPRDERGGRGRERERSTARGGDRSRDRGSAQPRGVRAEEQPQEEGTKLYVGAGRKEGMRPSTLIQFLVTHAGIDRRDVFRIQIREGYSFVSVSKGVADEIVAKANGQSLGEKQIVVELARPRQNDLPSEP
ncbi:MAG: DEAD/DEAH box helicase [Polyangia bacterium]|nr:DEAD/DEAH box helicase [Polyangia bacterium]